jgi:hypothetical protein
MGWPTHQPSLRQDNLGLRQYACLFSCIQFRNLLAAANGPSARADYWGEIPMVLLLAYVPHVQVTGVTCSRNPTASCAFHFGLVAYPIAPCMVLKYIGMVLA